MNVRRQGLYPVFQVWQLLLSTLPKNLPPPA